MYCLTQQCKMNWTVFATRGSMASFHEINSHKINCHEINCHEINSYEINLTLSRQYACGDKLMIVNHSRLNRYSIHWSRAVRSHPLLHSGDFRTCIKKNTQIGWWLSLSEKVLAICKLEFGQLFRFSRPLPFLFSLTCMVEEVGKRGEG